MLMPVEWLKQFIDIKTDVKEIALDLTLLGHEVEKILPGDIVDCDITPNRGDCLSIVGLARELAAFRDLKLSLSKIQKPPKSELSVKFPKIDFETKNLCPIYTFIVLEGVRVTKSPNWMKKRLKACDIRPINNIVDITNYVMLETGQPLHAFDLDKIQGYQMLIRKAKKGETITALDDKIHRLTPEVLVIQDSEKLIDLAGIMGGQTTEVDQNTKRILLQAAIFPPAAIRRSSKILKKSTDASSRYERGVDAENCKTNLLYPAKLFEDITKAKSSKPQVIINQKVTPIKIGCSYSKINRLLGTNIPEKQIDGILERLGFKIDNSLVHVPSWRAFDIKIWQDLAEEVARIYGYNRLPTTRLKRQKVEGRNQTYLAIEKIKDTISDTTLTYEKYMQTENYSFVSSKDLKKIGFNKNRCLKLTNPVSELNEYLRPNLKIGLLKTIANNRDKPTQKLFEIGKVFLKNGETFHLAIASTFPDIELLKKEFKKITDTLNIKVNQESQQISTSTLKEFKIKRPVFYIEFDLTNFLKKINIRSYDPKLSRIKKLLIESFSKLPIAKRDLAFIVNKDVEASTIGEFILQIDLRIFSVNFFDDFISDKFGKNKKNIAFHIIFKPQKETLKDSQIKEIVDKIVNRVEKRFSAKLRKK